MIPKTDSKNGQITLPRGLLIYVLKRGESVRIPPNLDIAEAWHLLEVPEGAFSINLEYTTGSGLYSGSITIPFPRKFVNKWQWLCQRENGSFFLSYPPTHDKPVDGTKESCGRIFTVSKAVLETQIAEEEETNEVVSSCSGLHSFSGKC